MKKKILFILFISGCFLTGSNAQSIAVKSNLLYDATSTLNMGVELGRYSVNRNIQSKNK